MTRVSEPSLGSHTVNRVRLFNRKWKDRCPSERYNGPLSSFYVTKRCFHLSAYSLSEIKLYTGTVQYSPYSVSHTKCTMDFVGICNTFLLSPSTLK